MTGWSYTPPAEPPKLFGASVRPTSTRSLSVSMGGWNDSTHTETEKERESRTRAMVKGSYREKVSAAAHKYGPAQGATQARARRSAPPRRPTWDVDHNKIEPPPRRLDENWQLSPGREPAVNRMEASQTQYTQTLGTQRGRMASVTAKVSTIRRVLLAMGSTSPSLNTAQEALQGHPEPGDFPSAEPGEAGEAADDVAVCVDAPQEPLAEEES